MISNKLDGPVVPILRDDEVTSVLVTARETWRGSGRGDQVRGGE
jgi:hypothetical protein